MVSTNSRTPELSNIEDRVLLALVEERVAVTKEEWDRWSLVKMSQQDRDMKSTQRLSIVKTYLVVAWACPEEILRWSRLARSHELPLAR